MTKSSLVNYQKTYITKCIIFIFQVAVSENIFIFRHLFSVAQAKKLLPGRKRYTLKVSTSELHQTTP